MTTILVFILALLLIIIAILHIAYTAILNKSRLLLGYKLYEYEKILSAGIKKETHWFKTDEEAMLHAKQFDFVRRIKPFRQSLKPTPSPVGEGQG